jgi:hypothetical protein
MSDFSKKISPIINDPYTLIDIAFPHNYKLFLDFPYHPVFTTKTQLRTLENDKLLFMDEIYSKYDIFMYNNGILIYSMNNNIYWKNINEEDFIILKEGLNHNIIESILKTQNIINTNIENRIVLYNINNPFQHNNFSFLQDLLRFEIDSLMNIEIKEQYFNKYKINDNTLTLYLPHNTQIYFLINTFYNKIIDNNTININILLTILNNYKNTDYNDEIKKYLSSIWLFYVNLPNNFYTIEKSTETIDYTPYKNIIYEAYGNYINFINELNNKNMEERIEIYIKNNITINNIYLLTNKFALNCFRPL